MWKRYSAKIAIGNLAAIASLALWLLAILPASAAESFFPFGIYDKSFPKDRRNTAQNPPPLTEVIEHYRRVFALMKERHLNVLVARPYQDVRYTQALFDLAAEFEIKVIMTVINPRNPQVDRAGPRHSFHSIYTHPALFAYKYGDEPKDERAQQHLQAGYGAIRRHYDAPIMTATLGESFARNSARGNGDYTRQLWQALDVRVRAIRYYPLRREYDLHRWYEKKLVLAPHEAFRLFEDADRQTPWWYVMQTFGKGTQRDRQAYWRLPTARELTSLGHMALARGARGILGFSLQNAKPHLFALVGRDLQPTTARDGSMPLDAYERLGEIVGAHAEILSRHQPLDVPVASSRSEVLTVARFDPDTQRRYVYAVNMDAESSHSARAFLPKALHSRRATDIYADERLELQFLDEDWQALRLNLKAGQGRLIELE